MHSCRVCDKSYRSRGSLTRHLRNHSVGSSQHICPTCDVAFSRRDLLKRHLQIHNRSENQPVSPGVSNEPTRSATRQRCHTACQPCREARVKCNGEYPCAQCVSSQTECQFRNRTHRVSRIIEGDAAHENETSPDNGAMGDDEVFSDAQPSAAMPAAQNMLQSPISNVRSPVMHSFNQVEPISNLSHVGVSEMDLSWANSLPCTTESWPWLHENLFLQGDPMLNGVEDLYSSGLDQFGLIQDSGFNHPQGVATPHVVARTNPSLARPFNFDTPVTASAQTDNRMPPEQEERIEDQRPHHPDVFDAKFQTALEEKLVEELVTYPGNRAATPGSKLSRSFYWQHMSIRIAETFRFDSWPSGDSKSSLYRMMEMYKENFSPLWPLLSGKDFDPDRLHPLLFLTVVSIGCMYGTTRECKFGNILHEHIRKHLAESLIGLESGESDILWLGQARLLTQVAALYFGQRRGFSYAQHIGAILIAQARRMDLFSTLGSGGSGSNSIEHQLSTWQNGESRKRLVFGILRADIFASVLLNTRPLLSAEEIYLDLPADDKLWRDLDKISQDQLVAHLRTEIPGTLGLPFCDLIRVAEDREEALPNLNARGYELLIFGLQDRVWRFSHDRTMFPRLTGQSSHTTHQPNGAFPSPVGGRHSIPNSSQSDQLGITFRQMNDLRDDCRRITQTLQKWEQTFATTRTSPRFNKDRTCVMSSMLLLHISYMRLCAPLSDLHSVAYAIMDKKSFDQAKLKALYEWAESPEAMQAVGSVQQIWSFLHHESNRSGPEKARYNLLAFSGLHHAAVIIWAFAGAHPEQSSEIPDLPGCDDSAPIPLRRDNSGTLLRNVVSLYKRLIPRGWISFAAAAEHLAAHPFPECCR